MKYSVTSSEAVVHSRSTYWTLFFQKSRSGIGNPAPGSRDNTELSSNQHYTILVSVQSILLFLLRSYISF